MPATTASREAFQTRVRLVERSKRFSGARFPIEFMRATDTGAPPLARLVRDGPGGRGGEVRLKLYLCLTLLATRSPYDIHGVNPWAWARALGLRDPDKAGTRRINDALDWLRDAHFIELERHSDGKPTVMLLSPAGDGGRYRDRSGPAFGNRYVSLPVGFWIWEWITTLSATGVALLLVLLDLQGGYVEDDPPWIGGQDRKRYGLSEATWTRATEELTDTGLLTVRREWRGHVFDRPRLRNTYWIDKERLNHPPGEPLTPAEEEALLPPDLATYFRDARQVLADRQAATSAFRAQTPRRRASGTGR
ncbi:hypothetical protein I6A60_39150 [Frankia sp. AgB1.9]|uniref:hypothetical protein n=1 Tax=unclassified Frankia TaxID=2632575 RepID=UPI001932FCFF|nr:MULTISPECIES: hypothetical protein [unclassified Frankia]MBL7491556.1 hypothetical protein [Frankia sp. AgW1.1]MBL7553803.1 hypothetical protein [Frankia sp. AgB1.9]MBL7617903.1 hypothetical protein [Frankia sp. AgB1.8]